MHVITRITRTARCGSYEMSAFNAMAANFRAWAWAWGGGGGPVPFSVSVVLKRRKSKLPRFCAGRISLCEHRQNREKLETSISV